MNVTIQTKDIIVFKLIDTLPRHLPIKFHPSQIYHVLTLSRFYSTTIEFLEDIQLNISFLLLTQLNLSKLHFYTQNYSIYINFFSAIFCIIFIFCLLKTLCNSDYDCTIFLCITRYNHLFNIVFYYVCLLIDQVAIMVFEEVSVT